MTTILMSKTRTKTHTFFFEGMYFKSPQAYVQWLAAQKTANREARQGMIAARKDPYPLNARRMVG
ncbi:MAG: hypothetical protein FWC97_12635 [Treponema sp.]|nr:hypothetical protein [Treponema sp.]